MKRRRIQVPPSGTGRYVPAEVIEMICDEELAGRPLAPVVELLSPRLRPEDREELSRAESAPDTLPPAPAAS